MRRYFEANTKYLQLADKATRTVAMLTERLDQHRGRGQQQIVVKHVTVNADQAVVTDTVVTGKPAGNAEPSLALLTNAAEKPMPMLDETGKLQPVGGVKKRNEHQPHAQGPRRSPMHRQIKADREALSCACGARLAGLPDARRTRWCAGGQTERKLPARRPLEGNNRALEAHQIASLMSAFGGKADMTFCTAYVCF